MKTSVLSWFVGLSACTGTDIGGVAASGKGTGGLSIDNGLVAVDFDEETGLPVALHDLDAATTFPLVHPDGRGFAILLQDTSAPGAYGWNVRRNHDAMRCGPPEIALEGTAAATVRYERCSLGTPGDRKHRADVLLRVALPAGGTAMEVSVDVQNVRSDRYAVVGAQLNLALGIGPGEDLKVLTQPWTVVTDPLRNLDPAVVLGELLDGDASLVGSALQNEDGIFQKANIHGFEFNWFAYPEDGVGLYMMPADPGGHVVKALGWGARDQASLLGTVAMFSGDDGAPGQDFTMPAPVVVGTLRGDWFDFASLLRTSLVQNVAGFDTSLRDREMDDRFKRMALLEVAHPDWVSPVRTGQMKLPAETLAETAGLVSRSLLPEGESSVFFVESLESHRPAFGFFDVAEGTKELSDTLVRNGVLLGSYTHPTWVTPEDPRYEALGMKSWAATDATGAPYLERDHTGRDSVMMSSTSKDWQDHFARGVREAGIHFTYVDAPYSNRPTVRTDPQGWDGVNASMVSFLEAQAQMQAQAGFPWAATTESNIMLQDLAPHTVRINPGAYGLSFGNGYYPFDPARWETVPLVAVVLHDLTPVSLGNPHPGVGKNLNTDLDWSSPSFLGEQTEERFVRTATYLDYQQADLVAGGAGVSHTTLGLAQTSDPPAQWSVDAWADRLGRGGVSGVDLVFDHVWSVVGDDARLGLIEGLQAHEAFLGELTRARAVGEDWLVYGRMLKPPRVEAESLEFHVYDWMSNALARGVAPQTEAITVPAVLASHWRDEDNGADAVFVVNPDDVPHEAIVDLAGHARGKVPALDVLGGGCVVLGAELDLSVSLAPHEMRLYVLRGVDDCP